MCVDNSLDPRLGGESERAISELVLMVLHVHVETKDLVSYVV